MKFNEYFKLKREEKFKILRDFCRFHNVDQGNYSKIERGLLLPSINEDKLLALAVQLDIDTNTEDYKIFRDLAYIANHAIPEECLRNLNIVEILPNLFDLFRGGKIKPEDYEKILNTITILNGDICDMNI